VPSGSPVIRSSFAIGPVPVAGAAEAVIGTVDGIETPLPGYRVQLMASGFVTVDPFTTDITVTLRRGDLTGVVVNTQGPIVVVPAALADAPFSITGTDEPGDVADQSYVLTVIQTAAAGATDAAYVSLIAITAP